MRLLYTVSIRIPLIPLPIRGCSGTSQSKRRRVEHCLVFASVYTPRAGLHTFGPRCTRKGEAPHRLALILPPYVCPPHRQTHHVVLRRPLMRLHRTLCHKWIAQDDARHKQAVTLLIGAIAHHLFHAELSCARLDNKILLISAQSATMSPSC